MTTSNCPFCKETPLSMDLKSMPQLYRFDCDVCGKYFISKTVYEKIYKTDINSSLLNCISENIKTNPSGNKYPITTSWHSKYDSPLPKLAPDITVKRLEDFSSLPIIHASKPRELLLLIASKSATHLPFKSIIITKKDLFLLKILNITELFNWLDVLEKNEWCKKIIIDIVSDNPGLSNIEIQMLPRGWEQVFINQQSINSKKVFLAMQFDWPKENKKRNQYIEAIKLGCKDCGYECELVNDKDHIDQITDRIVANIKSSRFVIADFTFNNRGAYYEAGLARGLGIPVIHTVMSGHTSHKTSKEKKLHFDIQQINYLEWASTTDLRQRIKEKIIATIEK